MTANLSTGTTTGERSRSPAVRAVDTALFARGLRLAEPERDRLHRQARHALARRRARGEAFDSERLFLADAALFLAIDEGHRRDAGDPPFAELGGPLAALAPEERDALLVRHVRGLPPEQAAGALGVGERELDTRLGAAARKLGPAGRDLRPERACASRRPLMAAYALDVLSPERARYGIAAGHVRRCRRCRAHVNALRGLAAVLPAEVERPAPVADPAHGVAPVAAAARPAARTPRASAPRWPRRALVAALAATVAAVALVAAVRDDGRSGATPVPLPVTRQADGVARSVNRVALLAPSPVAVRPAVRAASTPRRARRRRAPAPRARAATPAVTPAAATPATSTAPATTAAPPSAPATVQSAPAPRRAATPAPTTDGGQEFSP